jgi:hypothetical protein
MLGDKQLSVSPNFNPLKAGALVSPPQLQKKHSQQAPDLNGLVSVKPYERHYSNEVPTVTCQLYATQYEFIKVIACDEDQVRHCKLTQDASDRLEILK